MKKNIVMAKTALSEYLYVDESRLNSYIEQIGSPFKYDKVPVLKAELSFTGPRISREQQSFQRRLTTHEKVAMLTKCLSSSKCLHASRKDGARSSFKKDFVLETCDLTRFIIPSTKDSVDDIAAWISREPRGDRRSVTFQGKRYHYELLLLEDSTSHDAKSSPPSITKFSTLIALLMKHSDRIKKTILRDLTKIPLKGYGIRFLQLMLKGGKLSPYEQVMFSYSADPVQTLDALGCKIGIPRRVEVLYRVRYYSVNELARFCNEYSDNVLSVFGYPIYIIDAKS